MSKEYDMSKEKRKIERRSYDCEYDMKSEKSIVITHREREPTRPTSPRWSLEALASASGW